MTYNTINIDKIGAYCRLFKPQATVAPDYQEKWLATSSFFETVWPQSCVWITLEESTPRNL
jgi:hypothetical protein